MTGATGAINTMKGRGVANNAELRQDFKELFIYTKQMAKPWQIALGVSNLLWIGVITAITIHERRRKDDTRNALNDVAQARRRICKGV